MISVEAVILDDLVIDEFEKRQAKDGDFLDFETIMVLVSKSRDSDITRTDVREWIDGPLPGNLRAGREAGVKGIHFRPLMPYRQALLRCHGEASAEGTVPVMRVKLLLQAFVVLDQEQRDTCLQELVNDRLKAIKAGTMRRAAVDQLLHDSLITFRVVPERP